MVEKHESKVDEKVHLKYFVAESKSIGVSEDSNGHKLVEVPIQSLKEDRDGDVISEQGQMVLISALNRGLVPAFPNHGFGDYMSRYDFRDIMGNWVSGRLDDSGVTRGVLRLRKNNEAADHVLDLISQGMPLGFSVGFVPREVEERSNGGFLIHGLDLLEVSPVGIPSNPLAVVGYNAERVALAVKSVLESGSMSKKDVVSEVSSEGDVNVEGEVKSDDSKKESDVKLDESVEGSKACDEEEDKKPKKESDEEESEESDDSKKESEEEPEEDEDSKKEDSEDEEDDDSKKTDSDKSAEISELKVLIKSLKEEVDSLKKQKETKESAEGKEKAVKGEVPRKIKTVEKEEVESKKSVDSDLIDGYSASY